MKSKLQEKIGEVTDSLSEIKISEYDRNSLHSMQQHIAELPDDKTKPQDSSHYESLLHKAKKLQIEFEHTHPTISKSMAEIVKILGDIGI